MPTNIARTFEVLPVSLRAVSRSLELSLQSSLQLSLTVLVSYRTRGCIAISLGRSLPPALGCTLKQPDSRGNGSSGRAHPLPSGNHARRTGLSSSTVVGPDQRDLNERDAENVAFSLTSHRSDAATVRLDAEL